MTAYYAALNKRKRRYLQNNPNLFLHLVQRSLFVLNKDIMKTLLKKSE